MPPSSVLPKPDPPLPEEPSGWEHYDLWQRVRRALFAVPDHFATQTNIDGLLASDIFTLNAPLAATIEESVVKTLNNLRPAWDPDGRYRTWSFVRQSQTFPDVVLRTVDNGSKPLMGIELKGWYLLAREKQPTYRFTATAAACSPWDLLAVVPWALSNVLAGSPVLFRPFIQSARYCALKRNYYWRYERDTASNTEVDIPDSVSPYPNKRDRISDKPRSDSGGNFGRIARYGIMNDYMTDSLNQRVRGIAASDWVGFFARYGRDR